MNNIYLLIFLLFFMNAFSKSSEKINTPGVLVIEHDYLVDGKPGNSIKLYDKEFSCIDSISVYPPSDVSKFRREYKLRAYFPLHSIIIFDAMPLNEKYYRVNYDSTYGYIPDNPDKLKYLSWEQFLLSNILIGTIKNNPVRKEKTVQSLILDFNPDDVYMIIKDVDGDWIYVDIFQTEEIEKTIGSGWLKWRDANNNLLITIYYSF